MKTLLIASDHAGYKLKESIKKHFDKYKWLDFGPSSEDRVDYPDYAHKLCKDLVGKINSDDQTLGLLICGSGQGMSMTANKYPKIRAALCWNTEVAILAKQHNNANVLCLGSRLIGPEESYKVIEAFLITKFEFGRHQDRIDKIDLT